MSDPTYFSTSVDEALAKAPSVPYFLSGSPTNFLTFLPRGKDAAEFDDSMIIFSEELQDRMDPYAVSTETFRTVTYKPLFSPIDRPHAKSLVGTLNHAKGKETEWHFGEVTSQDFGLFLPDK